MERRSTLFADHLTQALEDASASFADDELAYLALTSKVEQPIRDRMAWALRDRLPGRVVAREWRRCDLALLDRDGVPLALVELKAMYDFDAVSTASLTAYKRRLEADIAKAALLAPEHAPDVFVLLLVTHIEGMPIAPAGVVKYASAMKRLPDRLSAERVASIVDAALKGLGSCRHGELATGSAFEAVVRVSYWLIGPTDPLL